MEVKIHMLQVNDSEPHLPIRVFEFRFLHVASNTASCNKILWQVSHIVRQYLKGVSANWNVTSMFIKVYFGLLKENVIFDQQN